MRTERDFSKRPPTERQWMVETTWCPTCRQWHLGITDPVEYEEDGQPYLEGKCKKCGQKVVSEIICKIG